VTDALTVVRRYTARTWMAGLFGFVFLFPILGNVISRLTRKRGWWLNDYDALICGAHSVGLGQSPYSLTPLCDGIRPAPFVYAPQVGAVFAPLVNGLGFAGARWVFLIPLVPALCVLLWFALVKAMPKAPFWLRLMTCAAINGSVLACGNIGLVLHAVVIAAALNLKRTRIPFVAAVILGAMVKPVFLTYLIVLLMQDRPVVLRLRDFAISVGLGLGAVAWLMLDAGPFGGAWHAILNVIVIQQQPGIGLFSYTSLIGLPAASPATQALYVPFAAVIAVSGLVLAEWGEFDASERVVLGLGVAQLLNPRLMDYDLFVLTPAVVMIVMQAKAFGPRTFAWVSWIFAGVLVFAVVINAAGGPHLNDAVKRAPIAVFVYCALLIFVALKTAQKHQTQIKALVKDPKALFAKAA
jgi:hypothetical protein